MQLQVRSNCNISGLKYSLWPIHILLKSWLTAVHLNAGYTPWIFSVFNKYVQTFTYVQTRAHTYVHMFEFCRCTSSCCSLGWPVLLFLTLILPSPDSPSPPTLLVPLYFHMHYIALASATCFVIPSLHSTIYFPNVSTGCGCIADNLLTNAFKWSVDQVAANTECIQLYLGKHCV